MMDSNKNSDICDEQPEPNCRQEIKTLSTLNEDVVVQILRHLQPKDLVNVVYTSKMFLNSCRRVVEEMYKNKYFAVQFEAVVSKNCSRSAFSFNTLMDFFRYFGKDIAKIRIDYRNLDDVNSKRFHDLILETCHETVIDIEFWYMSTDLKINKCFPKLKYLNIYYGNIDDSLCQFHKWFPKVEKLLLKWVENVAANLKTIHEIPTLKHFSFAHTYRRNEPDSGLGLNQFVENNPQLEVLVLRVIGYWLRNAEVISYLTIPNDRIEHLEVHFCSSSEVIDFVAKCRNLKTLVLNDALGLCSRTIEPVDIFRGDTWKQSAKSVLLTHLEINFLVFYNVDPLIAGHLAILPYLEQLNLNTVKVKYQFCCGKNWIVSANASSFDAIKTRIDLKRWTFTYEILLDERVVSFTLNKLSVGVRI